MKYIRLFLGSVIVLFFLITIISLFIPSHIKLSKAINLKAGKEKVMSHISEPQNWKKWYPGLDSAEIIYGGEMIKGWVLDKNKKAKIELTKFTADEVQAEFTGGKTNPVLNGWKIMSYPGNDSVAVQWYMDFHLRWYPWEKFASLLLEKSYGLKMEQGLTNLKQVVEN